MKRAKFAESYVFEKDGKQFIVAWVCRREKRWESHVRLPRPNASARQKPHLLGVSDMYGNTMEINDNNTNDLNGRVGKIRLIIDGYPRYFSLRPIMAARPRRNPQCRRLTTGT